MNHFSTRHTNNLCLHTHLSRWQVTFSPEMQIQMSGAPHQCISLLALYEYILAVPALRVPLGSCGVESTRSVNFLPLGNLELSPIGPLICILGCLLSSETRSKCPKGDWQPSKRCIMKPEDTACELNLKAKVTLVKVLSLNSWITRVSQLQ